MKGCLFDASGTSGLVYDLPFVRADAIGYHSVITANNYGSIKSCSVIDSEISGGVNSCGAIAAKNSGTIHRCEVNETHVNALG